MILNLNEYALPTVNEDERCVQVTEERKRSNRYGQLFSEFFQEKLGLVVLQDLSLLKKHQMHNL